MRDLVFLPIAILAGCDAASLPVPSPVPSITVTAPIAKPALAPTAHSPLGAYVGKYPPDKVDGLGFLEQPLVRAGVRGAVSDPAIRAWILNKAGPQTPISVRDGKLLSWGCEAHMCGPHNWTVSIAPDGTGTAICYLDMNAPSVSGWYVGGAKVRAADTCPEGDDT